MSSYYAMMAGHQPQAYLAEVPEESKAVVYATAMEMLAERVEHEERMTSGAIH